ncbi:MAG: cell division protein ZapE, partial [Proteobacteria bacterium]|nr:cell division protein ZapE [Pseudomonadota bacterium]
MGQYQQRVHNGEIQDDAAQREVLAVLQQLCDALHPGAAQGGLLARLLGKAPPAPRGCYIWGNVGRGKSMLMDLFFAHAPVEKKRRIHFHAGSIGGAFPTVTPIA